MSMSQSIELEMNKQHIDNSFFNFMWNITSSMKVMFRNRNHRWLL